MPDDSDTPPPSTKDDSNDDDADHRDEEAAEILSDLLQNQASVSNAKSLNGTQVGEAQQAALQQLIRQEPSAVLNQQSVRALLDAMGGDSRGDVAAGEGGRKHVFWDTQVRHVCVCH